MELDPRNAYAALEIGFGQIYALALSYSLSVVGAVVLLIVGYVAAGLAERSISGALKHVRGFDLTLRRFFAMLARYAILILVVVMVLGQFGVQTASIIAAIGAIGLAIGLALQGTLQNIAAGIMLLVLRPFRIGEEVEVGPVTGTVQEIGLFATRLRREDGVFLLAPNSTLWNQPVRNFTRNGVRRDEITITVSDGDDIDLVRKALLDTAASEPKTKGKPPPETFISELGDDSAKVTLRYWTSAADFFAAKAELTRKIRDNVRKSSQS
jgi:small conductance mechanosensitive channel